MGHPTIAHRVADRFRKQAAEVTWLPDILGTKTRVVDSILKAIKELSREQSAFPQDPKSAAGGVFYFLVKDKAGESVAQKLWALLDASAGLSTGDKIWRIAQRASHLLSENRDKGSVEAAAVGVALLQRTRQQTKAQRANDIMLGVLKDKLAEYGPPESEPTKTKAQLFADMIGKQKALARQVAKRSFVDPAVAAIIVWEVLTDVNAHEASSVAESILSPLVTVDEARKKKFEESQTMPLPPNWEKQWETDANQERAEIARKVVSNISQALDYGIVEAGAFGVALMEAVGQPSYAKKLATAMTKVFAEYIGESDL